jgi:L-ascorbate metabolism protein UlaG (beta-lactamase superfamily)
MTAELKYYGHSCFELRMQGKSIIFDPFITPNPLASEIDLHTLKPDYMLISHGHYDHIADAVQLAQNSGCRVIACFEIHEWLQRQGVHNTMGMNIGGTADLGFAKVRMMPAVHSSSFPDGSYAGQAAGFLISSPELNLYYSGDTDLTRDMELIPDICALDAAFICLGGHFTMDYKDALRCAEMIRCEHIIGMHFDTFEPIRLDHKAAMEHFSTAGRKLSLPKVGEHLMI